jgi:PhzF family phenazine biosynthesis protein
VDTFTQAVFHGNPTGVVLLDQSAATEWMQAVACEFNHPATAFIDIRLSNAEVIPLRCFSPSTELEYCGSGTLAAAHLPRR